MHFGKMSKNRMEREKLNIDSTVKFNVLLKFSFPQWAGAYFRLGELSQEV